MITNIKENTNIENGYYNQLIWQKSLECVRDLCRRMVHSNQHVHTGNETFRDFYRAMHFSAKRGIAIACRLSVCLSVCL